MTREILGGHPQRDRMRPPRRPPVQYGFEVSSAGQLTEVQLDPKRIHSFEKDRVIYPKNGSFGVVQHEFNAYRLDPPKAHEHDIRGLTGWKALQNVPLYNGLRRDPFWTLHKDEEFGAYVRPPRPRRSHRHHE